MSCVCLSAVLPELGPAQELTLLFVDAEGYDDRVLSQFPFSSVRVARVVFEGVHLKRPAFEATAALLQSHGFELVWGGRMSYQSTWHRVNSTEPVLRGDKGPAGANC